MGEIAVDTRVSVNRYNSFSIELDCAPGNPRPGDLIDGVLLDTGLQESDFDTGAPFFGHQVWVLKPGDPEKDALYTSIKETVIKPRVEALYHAGRIRYGSW